MILVAVSTGHFDPLVEVCNQLAEKYSFFGQIGSSTVIPAFPFVRTLPTEELEKKMAQSDLVISHAGTGMLSSLYRLKKPTIVVPKQKRYGEANDGQVELARKWAELGMGILCLDLRDLERCIQEASRKRFEYPVFPALGLRLRHQVAWDLP